MPELTKKPKKIVTYKYKIFGNKNSFKELDRQARAVNFVWNYCVQVSLDLYKNRINNFHYINQDDKKIKKQYSHQVERVPFQYSNEYINTPIIIKQRKNDNTSAHWNMRYPPPTKNVRELELFPGHISFYDLTKLTGGSGSLLGISSQTVVIICKTFTTAVDNKKTAIINGLIKLNVNRKQVYVSHHDLWHSVSTPFVNFRNKKSKPWIPVKGRDIKVDYNTGILTFRKKDYKLNIDRHIDGNICDAKFVKEIDGWYISISLDVKQYGIGRINTSTKDSIIGVDLGLKDFLVVSNGVKFDIPKEPIINFWGRSLPASTMINSLKSYKDRYKNRKNNKESYGKKYELVMKKIRKIEQKIKRTTEQSHYNIAHKLLDMADTVVIGDLSAKWMQSIAGKKYKWYSFGYFKQRIEWLAKKRGKTVILINEAWTTRTCSVCNERTGPTDTLIREWECPSCKTLHDRDVNGAKNMVLFYQRQLLQKPAKVD